MWVLKNKSKFRRVRRRQHEELVPCLNNDAMETTNNEEAREGEDKKEEPAGIVKPADVYFLANELTTVASRWGPIGGHLGFLPGELENIAVTVSARPPDEYLIKLLTEWTQWPTSKHKDYPTMDSLCEALRSQSVGMGRAADKLDSKRNQLPSMMKK